MKTFSRFAIASAAMLGAAVVANGTAQARTDFSISIGVPNAIGFDSNSGGYCDSDGCPDQYWNYQVWYGPVFYHNEWFRGPVYFRQDWDGSRTFWIRGGWHHDQWHGRRPSWWYQNHYYAGPALGYEFYAGHGFRHDHDRYWHGEGWNRDHGDHHDRNGGYDWNNQSGPHDWNGQDRHDGNDHGDHHNDHAQGNNSGNGWNGQGNGWNGGSHGDNNGSGNPHDHGNNNSNPTAAPNNGHGNGNAQSGGQNGNTQNTNSQSAGGGTNNSGNAAGSDNTHHHHHDHDDNGPNDGNNGH